MLPDKKYVLIWILDQFFSFSQKTIS